MAPGIFAESARISSHAASVVFARRTKEPVPLGDETIVWSGRLPRPNLAWEEAQPLFERTPGIIRRVGKTAKSAFDARFGQGATFAPRLLFLVDERPAGPLGLPAGRMAVVWSRSNYEDKRYKNLPSVEGVVESEYVRPIFSGESLLPYRVADPLRGYPLLKHGPAVAARNRTAPRPQNVVGPGGTGLGGEQNERSAHAHGAAELPEQA